MYYFTAEAKTLVLAGKLRITSIPWIAAYSDKSKSETISVMKNIEAKVCMKMSISFHFFWRFSIISLLLLFDGICFIVRKWTWDME